jgi:3-hydroxybutyryl-CoA dehydratase
VTGMVTPHDLGSISVGMSVEETVTFTEADLRTFADLIDDEAPVHWDAEFARSRGYPDRIVYGFLVASRFSGMLGTKLPGPNCVIHSVKFEMVAPVFVGEAVRYEARVTQLAKAVKTVVLDLRATRADGTLALRGTAQCGFAR